MGGVRKADRYMTHIAPHTRANAKRLRAEATPQERLVWAELRDLNRAFGAHFRRQAPIGPFIADFADYTRRLVIEIDGSGHGGGADVARDAYLAAQGFVVLRFWNSDVIGNLEGVLQVVMDALNVAPPPQPSPTGGEGEARVSGFELVADGDTPPPQRASTGGEGGALPISAHKVESLGVSPPPGGEGSGVGGHRVSQTRAIPKGSQP